VKVALVYPDYAPSKTLAAPADYGFYAEGVSAVAAALEEAGHDVNLIHLIGSPGRDEFEAKVREAAPDVVGFSSRTTVWPEIRRLAGIAREAADAPVVAGGVHATLAPEEVATSPEIDVAVVGEGEYPLLELCEALEAGRDWRAVDNLWFRENGDVRRNPTRPLIADLDALPPAPLCSRAGALICVRTAATTSSSRRTPTASTTRASARRRARSNI
jgi:radical SAM superfamily enzyme YgiQ (UPF0313 family)